MDLIQEINALDVEIIKRNSLIRTAQTNHIIANIKKFSGYTIIIIGIGVSSYSQAIVPIIGLVFEAFATIESNKTSKILKTMEYDIIELQTRRASLWAEMMAKVINNY